MPTGENRCRLLKYFFFCYGREVPFLQQIANVRAVFKPRPSAVQSKRVRARRIEVWCCRNEIFFCYGRVSLFPTANHSCQRHVRPSHLQCSPGETDGQINLSPVLTLGDPRSRPCGGGLAGRTDGGWSSTSGVDWKTAGVARPCRNSASGRCRGSGPHATTRKVTD